MLAATHCVAPKLGATRQPAARRPVVAAAPATPNPKASTHAAHMHAPAKVVAAWSSHQVPAPARVSPTRGSIARGHDLTHRVAIAANPGAAKLGCTQLVRGCHSHHQYAILTPRHSQFVPLCRHLCRRTVPAHTHTSCKSRQRSMKLMSRWPPASSRQPRWAFKNERTGALPRRS